MPGMLAGKLPQWGRGRGLLGTSAERGLPRRSPGPGEGGVGRGLSAKEATGVWGPEPRLLGYTTAKGWDWICTVQSSARLEEGKRVKQR